MELNFKEFIEGRGGISTGGAFGKNNQSQLSTQYRDRDSRVRHGRNIESQIFDSLRSCGMELRPATQNEDKYQKIDAWWNKDGSEVPLQIKYKQDSPNISLEIYRDFDRKIKGRDFSEQNMAKYYAIMIHGNIKVVDTSSVRELIEKTLDLALRSNLQYTGIFRHQGITLRLAHDPSDMMKKEGKKLLAYIDPNMLPSVFPTCQTNIKVA